MSVDITPWISVRQQLGMSLMDHLFDRLSGKYPGRWSAQFKNERAIENWRSEWADAFVKNHITPYEVARGLDACNDLYEWPPSLPEFLRACRPPVDAESAFREAARQMARRHADGSDVWSSPVVFWAAVRFGYFDLQHMSWDQAKGRWTKILDELSGVEVDPIPARAEALPEPGNAVVPKEKALRLMAELKEKIRLRVD